MTKTELLTTLRGEAKGLHTMCRTLGEDERMLLPHFKSVVYVNKLGVAFFHREDGAGVMAWKGEAP